MPMREKVANPKGKMWRNIVSRLIAYSVFCKLKLFATILVKFQQYQSLDLYYKDFPVFPAKFMVICFFVGKMYEKCPSIRKIEWLY